MAPEASDSEANPRMANDSVDDKKHSWASEVEEDQDATGWRLQQEAAGSTSLPVYPSEPTKQKKFKKKKKNNSHHQHSSKAVKQERERLETAPNSMGGSWGSRFEAEFKDLNVSVDRMSGQNSHATPHDDVGWQVTSSQKASHAQSSHTLPLSNHSFPSPPCRPGPGMLPTPGLRYAQPDVAGPFGGHGEGAGYGGKVKAGSLGGRGEGAGYGGKVNAGLFGEHGEGTSYGGKLNVGNAQPARNSEPLLVQPWGVPDAPPQRSRSYPDASKAVSQNVYESESSNKRNWRGHSQPQRIVESQLYSQSSTDDARKVSTTLVAQACSIGCSNVQKGQQVHVNDWDISPPVSTAKEELNKTQMNPNILMKLLPSERGEEREFLKSGSSGTSGSLGTKMNNRISFPPPEFDDLPCTVDSDSACSDGELDDDSDWIGSDPFDSDGSVKSLDTRKQNKWLRSFFYTLDDFTNEQILEHDRQWHCPACQGGVGAIVWYRGLQPLIAHAKTHRTKRIGLHREFAKVLEEELEMRRAGTGSLGETKFGKWKGLRNDDAAKNPLIVWPPIVVIQNTQLEQDEQEKWIGMGNKELLDMFKEYCPMKARHAYGPHGHRGMSLVIFADSPTGYYNAERLAKQFKDSRRGKEHWDQPGKLIFLPGRDRILYGYMATAEDLDNFNRHSSGKSKLKWEVKKYQEAVAQPMRQMYEDNQQLNYLKIKVQKQKEHSKTLEKSMSVFTRKLELRENEISVIRERAKEQHGENQKEMDDLERTYKERIVQLQRDSARREQEMQEKQEEFKQEHIERYQQLEKKLGEEEQQPKQATVEEAIQRQTEIVESSLQDSEDYEYQKRELMKQHHLKKREFMRKQYEEALEFEKELEKERQALLDNYRRQMEEASSKS